MLSGVVHGDAGGLFGLTKELHGAVVHRVGPDLQLLPVAYLYGFRWLAHLLKEAATRHNVPAAELAAEHADYLVTACWPEILKTCQDLDRRVWPNRPPPQPGAVAAFYTADPTQVRWYFHDPHTESVTVADVDPRDQELVDSLAPRFAEPLREWRSAGEPPRPMTVRVLGVRVRPREGARPAPAASVLMPEHLQQVVVPPPTPPKGTGPVPEGLRGGR